MVPFEELAVMDDVARRGRFISVHPIKSCQRI
jgi:hypothetical protein